MHQSILPISTVDLPTRPQKRAKSLHLILNEVSLVGGLASPRKLAFSVLTTVEVLSRIVRAIWILLIHVPFQFIIFPFSRAGRAIDLVIKAFAILLALQPLAFIVISIRKDHSPLPRGLVLHPVAFIDAAVWKQLLPLPAPLALLHFTEVLSSIGHAKGTADLPTILQLIECLVELEAIAIGPQLLLNYAGRLAIELRRLQILQPIAHHLQLNVLLGPTVLATAPHPPQYNIQEQSSEFTNNPTPTPTPNQKPSDSTHQQLCKEKRYEV